MRRFAVIFLALIAVASLDAAPINNLKLKFRIFARDLPDKDDLGAGTSDPYAELFYTEDDSKKETKIGKTATLNDNENPDWGETFEFDFVRSKKQRFILRVYDSDPVSDDTIGFAYVDVAEFVDKQQRITVNLNTKGYVVLESVVPVSTSGSSDIPKPPPLPTQSSFTTTVRTSSVIPLVHGDPNKPQKITFRLSAKNLLNKDSSGLSDPFVEVKYSEREGSKQTKFAITKVIDENLNPVWPDVIEFDYDPLKNQKLHFEVEDSDFGDSDGLGKAELVVKDYIAKGQRATLNLSKGQGILVVESATGAGTVTGTTPLFKSTAPTTTTTTSRTTTTTKPTPPPLVNLRFKLSAKGLEDKDLIGGTSDPYVKVYYKEGLEKDTFIKNTQKFANKEDVDFPDVFEFTYNPVKQPTKLRFLVLDEDDNAKDEELGDVWIDVADYIKDGQDMTVKLPKGTLRIFKA